MTICARFRVTCAYPTDLIPAKDSFPARFFASSRPAHSAETISGAKEKEEPYEYTHPAIQKANSTPSHRLYACLVCAFAASESTMPSNADPAPRGSLDLAHQNTASSFVDRSS